MCGARCLEIWGGRPKAWTQSWQLGTLTVDPCRSVACAGLLSAKIRCGLGCNRRSTVVAIYSGDSDRPFSALCRMGCAGHFDDAKQKDPPSRLDLSRRRRMWSAFATAVRHFVEERRKKKSFHHAHAPENQGTRGNCRCGCDKSRFFEINKIENNVSRSNEKKRKQR